jgi:hypothetical protein
MARHDRDFYYIKNGKKLDENIHNEILDDGDHAAAKKVSDSVASDVGLTQAEIDSLSAPPVNVRGKKK